jgi:recombination protein RecR
MSDATPTMSRLIKAFQGLPGIGARTAERLAFYLMNAPAEEAGELAAAITEMRSRLTECSVCFNRGDADPCALCSDPTRDRTLLCVVETSRDVARIEETGLFRGLYHVLKGHLAPLDGIGPEQLTLEALVRRAKEQGVKEVILATNPTLESDATALEVVERLRPLGVRLTRLARGLPMGGTLEFVNRGVLTDALQGRQEVK